MSGQPPDNGAPEAAYIWTPRFLSYKLGPDHPFDPLRLRLTDELIRDSGLLLPAMEREPRAASREELLLSHAPEYVDAVERFSVPPPDEGTAAAGAGAAGSGAAGPFRITSTRGGMHAAWDFEEPDPNDPAQYGLGSDDNPIFPGMHEAASWWVGATLTAAEEIMEGRCKHALNLGGGLHHAQRDRASGFCIYNDAAIAIAWLKRRYGARVMYVDTDAHHGDGVQWLFYHDPNVLTVSYHETGRYLFPGSGSVEEHGAGPGLGFSVNLPLEPYTDDASWLEVLNLTLPALTEAFQPDIIISQNGCDGHFLDPLTHLSASLGFYREGPKLVHQLAHQYAGGRWIGVGGGGYDHWRVVPRAWTALWAEMSDQALPPEVPGVWRARWAAESPVPLPETWADEVNSPDRESPRLGEIREYNRRTAERALHLNLPLIRAARGT